MKKIPILFLQGVVLLIGVGALAFLLLEPHFEGRNLHATLFQIYFNDPFLAYAYVASIPFFVALSRAFRLLGYIGRGQTFSRESVKALRTIRYCAMSLVGLVLAPEMYLFIVRPGDDIAGGVFVGLLLIFIFSVMGAGAMVFEGVLERSEDARIQSPRQTYTQSTVPVFVVPKNPPKAMRVLVSDAIT
jgi:hypothetical protein